MSNKQKPHHARKKQALALLQGNRLAEAKAILESMCKINQDDIESWILLVKINAQLGRADKVEACCREIIRIDPNSHEAHFHLGSALLFQDKRSDAMSVFQSALRLNPGHAPTHFAIGILTDNLDTALDHFTRAIELDPSHMEANRGIACALVAFGQVEDAVSRMQACLNSSPTDYKTRSNLLFSLNYSPVYDAATVYSEHARWGQIHSLATTFRHHNTPEPERRLRVGYVSPDLCEHSVAHFLEPLLANHSSETVETYCYAEVARPDAVTSRLQSLTAHWRSTCGIGDRELAERIHADRIDILVDLAGHTVNNRLLVFSAKPAPVQVTYLGYPNTTGLTTMDYRLTDVHADPAGQADDYHTEKLFRLPHGFLCYLAPANAPPVAPAPVGTRGHITYGSFNNLSKLTPAVVALWADLLHTTPNARLVLKSNALSSGYARERYMKLFSDLGIGPEQIELRKRDPTVAEHLNSYSDIDIALDTFPYHGTTTTCEALFMGVPVVTLAGQTHASRVGASLLNQIGATDFIASTPDDYVRIASRLAQNRDELAQRRTTLRGQVAASPLCDAKQFAVDVESAFRDMWRQWCLNR